MVGIIQYRRTCVWKPGVHETTFVMSYLLFLQYTFSTTMMFGTGVRLGVCV